MAWSGSTLAAVGAAGAATAAHTSSSEPKVLPIAAACRSCHTSGAAEAHAEEHTDGAVEQCATCHGSSGANSVRGAHAVP